MIQPTLALIKYNSKTRKGKWWRKSSNWMLLSTNKELLESKYIARAAKEDPTFRNVKLWTDDYASLWDILYAD